MANSRFSISDRVRVTKLKIDHWKLEIEHWLPDMDLNHDKQIQSLLCYRYTIGQSGAADTVTISTGESSS